MSNPKIILVNGPPRSGKDTAQEAVPHSIRVKFAQAVKEGAHAAFGLDPKEYDMDYFEDCKEVGNPLFFGKTPREAYIAYSEIFMKPFTGDARVFGKLLVRKINSYQFKTEAAKQDATFIVTDSGFRAEAEEVVNTYGAENILLIRSHRKGCNYEGDSRGYISLADLGVAEVDVTNTDLDDYKTDIARIVREFTNAKR